MTQREIKFRAWDKNKMEYNPIAYDEWTSECQPLNPVINSIQSNLSHPQILMQFVGLLDKQGKEIYEGDIVKHYGLSHTSERKVKWKNAGFYPFATCQIYPEDCEIIGNIYENSRRRNKQI